MLVSDLGRRNMGRNSVVTAAIRVETTRAIIGTHELLCRCEVDDDGGGTSRRGAAVRIHSPPRRAHHNAEGRNES